MARISLVAALFVLVVSLGRVAGGQEVHDLFQKGLVQERAEGNLEKAVELFEQVVAKAEDNPELAAKAWLQIGACYERLGRQHQQEAKKAYQQVTNQFPGSAAARLARNRLGDLDGNATVTLRRVATQSGFPSPDGDFLTFTNWDTGNLAIHELATGVSHDLTQTSWKEPRLFAAGSSKVSPDGRQVAYVWKNENALFHRQPGGISLRFLSLDGNGEHATPRVFDQDKDVVYLTVHDWSPDELNVLVRVLRRDQSIQFGLISVENGSFRLLKSVGERSAGQICFSPDGSHVVYDLPADDQQKEPDVFLIAVDTLRETPIVTHPAHDYVMGWAPSGNHILFISDRSGTWDAWAIRVANGKAQGTARLIKQQIGPVEPLGFTRPGDCLYRVSTPNSNIYSATIDPQTHKLVGRPEKMVRRFMGRNQAPDWSPDGKQLAYVSQRGPFSPGFRSPWTLVVRTMETGVERELPLDLTNEWKWLGPNWSPDGRFLLANGRNSKRVYGLDRINVQTGDIQRILETSATGTPTWSKDGQSVIYARYDEPSNSRLFLERHLETGAENELWRQTEEYGIRGIEMSPDGQEMLLYSTDRLQVLPATGGEPRQLIKIEQDGIGRITGAVWSVDGHYVLFSRSNGHLWRIKASGGQTEHLGEGLDDSGLRIRLSMHPDGTRLAFHGQYGPETTDHVMALENFEAALADTSLSGDER